MPKISEQIVSKKLSKFTFLDYSYCRVFVLGGEFEVLYSDIPHMVGTPQDYMVNKKDGKFPSNVSVDIPLAGYQSNIPANIDLA